MTEPYDWADDESMSKDEFMARFEALKPESTTGPPSESGRGLCTADIATKAITNCRFVPKESE